MTLLSPTEAAREVNAIGITIQEFTREIHAAEPEHKHDLWRLTLDYTDTSLQWIEEHTPAEVRGRARLVLREYRETLIALEPEQEIVSEPIPVEPTFRDLAEGYAAIWAMFAVALLWWLT